ncbi:glycerol-3-phosphate dehydrogenase (NAD+) [Skeletonema marinoi]|uniref:Glycerol-3-phosphate dehydrogenase [NAD(+)] n=1 Tax=Skeletonema marinoi TaxID=267567 RepID=A0AAD8YGS7_9STRA|nr:glycerol-3-phosphate dehydrogenase (NAD+) [Skeletonema marinoi]
MRGVILLLVTLMASSPDVYNVAAFSFVPSRVSTRDDRSLLHNPRRSAPAKSHSILSMKATSPPPYPVRVTVMGGGNFGLALASVVAKRGVPVTLLVRTEEVAEEINENHRHPRYMTDIALPRTVRATANKKTALSDATYIIHAVPVQYTREYLATVKDEIPANVPILSASKGIETSSLGFMADILKECLGEDRSYAFLSGPSFAREICEGVATAVVIASEDLMLADDLAELMAGEDFAVFTSRDVIGVEVGGAVKNVIAIAAGMCEGLGLGTNAMSGLVTRGCGEMRRLGIYLGARPSTISGLSGVGDTFGTCFGPLSRNRQFGYRLGKGETPEEIRASMTEVAEGVDTSIALVKMIKKRCKGYRLDLKYPILFGVAEIIEGNMKPLEGLKGLMNFPTRMENYDERF